MWHASACAFTVVLEPAPADFAGAARLDPAAWPILLADEHLSDGRHLVLGDIDGPHHVWLRGDPGGGPMVYLVACDAAIELRRLAAARLDRRLAGAPPARGAAALRPSPFQRHRLTLLLAILDAVGKAAPGSGSGRMSTRDVAAALVYPRSRLPTGAGWKASSERRRTQRLIDEALAMMRGGYLRLLLGRTSVRQKAVG